MKGGVTLPCASAELCKSADYVAGIQSSSERLAARMLLMKLLSQIQSFMNHCNASMASEFPRR